MITDCLVHYIKPDVKHSEKEKGINSQAVVESMICDATEHVVQFTRGGLQNLLHPVGENGVAEESKLAEIGRVVSGMKDDTSGLKDSDSDDEK